MRRSKVGLFVVEGINSFTTCFFFNYLLFLLRDQFNFGNRENLAVCAGHGFIYIFFAWFGGKFAQKHGHFNALKVGFAGMAVALGVGALLPAMTAQLALFALWTMALCFTWPALEALISGGEEDSVLPKMVGLYNLVWAFMAGAGYFMGGAIFETFGRQGLYVLPLVSNLGQLAMVAWLARVHEREERWRPPAPTTRPAPRHQPEQAAFAQPVKPEVFLYMAWVANPFAYIAVNTLLATIPDLARRFQLSPTWSGIFCSLWFFTRFAAFFALWRWTGWHYRFRYLFLSYLLLVGGFLGLLLAQHLWLVVLAQIFFGLATGLIYYSSLFYSMDVGQESQGEHGGVHEAAIGCGICLGPAVGAGALYFCPGSANMGTWATGGVLLVGLAVLGVMRWRGRGTSAA